MAIYLNRLDLVKFLVDNGADTNLKDSYGTPLAAAVRQGNVDIIGYLLERGADAEICDLSGVSPFFRTILESKVSALEFFLRKGYSKKVDSSKNTPLVAAIRNQSSVETIKCLLKYDVDINGPQNGKTPLAWAATEGNVEAVKILLDRGADVNVLSQDGDTVLITAVKHKQLEVVEYLLESYVNSCKADKNGKTPLFWATTNTDPKTIKLLLNHGAEYIIDSVFLYAIETQNLRIVQLLKNNGASVSAPNDKKTPLMKCLEIGNVEIAKYLLENGADVVEDLGNKEIEKIIECMEKKNFDMVKLLTENGARLNQAADSRHTLLTKAVEMENFDMVKYFLSRGAEVNQANGKGLTALAIAESRNDFKTLQCLVDSGARMSKEEQDKNPKLARCYRIAVGKSTQQRVRAFRSNQEEA